MSRLHIPVALRWSDVDAYQHVNNVEFFRIFEEARIAALWRRPDGDASPAAILDAGPGAASQTLAVAHRVEYLKPLGYWRSPVRVELWFGRLGRSSVDVCYEVYPPDTSVVRAAPSSGDEPHARATTTLVVVDGATGRPRALTATDRAAWEPYLDDPPTFRAP